MMRGYYLLILPFLLILAVQEVSAQIQPNTFAVGGEISYGNGTWNDKSYYNAGFYFKPDVQYFYKENRAIIGGLIIDYRANPFQTYFHEDGSEIFYQLKGIGKGAFVGLRQHHPVNDRFHIFTEFGVMYSQYRHRSELVSGPPSIGYRGSSREEYSITGYGNVGIMYFINKRFSLETTLVNARINYNRPMNTESNVKQWKFELEGANQLSFALRYYFRRGNNEK